MNLGKRNTIQTEPFQGNIQPQAIDLEEAVLGAMLLDRNCIHSIVNILSPDVFYLPKHSLIYESILSLYDKGSPIDILTVTSELRSKGNLDKVGGAFYVTQLTSRIASTANIEQHAAILSQKYIARKLTQYGAEISNAAFDEEQDVFELLDRADIDLSKISEISIRGGSMTHISDASGKAIIELKIREKYAKEGYLVLQPGCTTLIN